MFQENKNNLINIINNINIDWIKIFNLDKNGGVGGNRGFLKLLIVIF